MRLLDRLRGTKRWLLRTPEASTRWELLQLDQDAVRACATTLERLPARARPGELGRLLVPCLPGTQLPLPEGSGWAAVGPASRRIPLVTRIRWQALTAGEGAGCIIALAELARNAAQVDVCLGAPVPVNLLLGERGELLLRTPGQTHRRRDAPCCRASLAEASLTGLIPLLPGAARGPVREALALTLSESDVPPETRTTPGSASFAEVFRYHLRARLTPIPPALPGVDEKTLPPHRSAGAAW